MHKIRNNRIHFLNIFLTFKEGWHTLEYGTVSLRSYIFSMSTSVYVYCKYFTVIHEVISSSLFFAIPINAPFVRL